MNTIINQITNRIERIIELGGRERIIIYPCGDIGIQTISVLKNVYDVNPAYIIDNNKCNFSTKIHDINFLKSIDRSNYYMFLACKNPKLYAELKDSVSELFSSNHIISFDDMDWYGDSAYTIKVGKYSYGELCESSNPFIESIGSFCSIADGVSVVENHEMSFISTHPFVFCEYPKSHKAHMDGIRIDHKTESQSKRTVIGHDVWLGKNVIIVNGVRIGNGVIAGAGAVITRNVPDYAVVGGVPARIIRFRYTQDQIESLNRIAWWDWTDERIVEHHDDFYLSIEEFIEKWDTRNRK